MTNYKARTLS